MHAFNCIGMSENQQSYYFLGIGGIGMSALARYFHTLGYAVSGYDRIATPLTRRLEQEGIAVVYADNAEAQSPDNEVINQEIARLKQYPQDRLTVVMTPAVPHDMRLYVWLREAGYRIVKRAEVLGLITRLPHRQTDGSLQPPIALCVAGSHGKTTTSTLLAHILFNSHLGCNAFLGGISENYQSNLLLTPTSRYVVAEADEYDRSFLHLTPSMTVITGIEPDHLDIYGTAEGYQEGFEQYAKRVSDAIVLKKGFTLSEASCPVYSYALDETADFYASHIRQQAGELWFDFHTPDGTITDIRLGVPVWVNIENAVAAMAIAWLNGVTAHELRKAIVSFKGVYRRFNHLINTPELVYIDDYAHHPTEIRNAIDSVRRLYPDRLVWVIFQPHLYTRTRDFMQAFAKALTYADRLFLLPIYPARELPIEGITSEVLARAVRTATHEQDKQIQTEVIQKAETTAILRQQLSEPHPPLVLLTIGAGDIDQLRHPLQSLLL